MLSSGSSGTDNLLVQNASLLTANKCLVQSNQNVTADGGASVTAGLTQATGVASGPITPAPQSGAPAIPDPFASMSIPPPSPLGCLTSILDLTQVLLVVLPGVHCGTITIGQGQTMMLLPGTHYFKGGTLTIKNNAVLKGSNVTLIFDQDATFNFTDTSSIDLTGAQAGNYAGFVILTTRNNTNAFTISSDNARRLEGAVYIPNATLNVTGTSNNVADQSAWTVVVAKSLQLQGSPNLVINANYAGSSVPVPAGAGNNYHSGKVTLSR